MTSVKVTAELGATNAFAVLSDIPEAFASFGGM